jgi:hypothetical protein
MSTNWNGGLEHRSIGVLSLGNHLALIRHYSFQHRSVDEPPVAGNAYCLDGPIPTHPNLTGEDVLFRRAFYQSLGLGARGFRLTALAQILKFG